MFVSLCYLLANIKFIVYFSHTLSRLIRLVLWEENIRTLTLLIPLNGGFRKNFRSVSREWVWALLLLDRLRS